MGVAILDGLHPRNLGLQAVSSPIILEKLYISACLTLSVVTSQRRAGEVLCDGSRGLIVGFNTALVQKE